MMQSQLQCQWQSQLSHHYDVPNSPADWVLLGAAIAATLPFLFANAVIIAYRRRTYFRALGGVDLILGSSLSGLIWLGSSFVVNQHFYRDRFIFSVCPLWSFWLYLAFGFCFWLVCLTMRLHRMQTLWIEGPEQERQSQLRAWTVLIPLFMIPVIVFCIVATIMKISHFETANENSLSPSHSFRSCSYKKNWSRATFLTLPPLYISVVLFYLYKLRGKTECMLMTEYKHTCEYLCMTIVIYFLNGVLYLTHGQERAAGRCFLTFCVCSMVFFDFWLHMGWPVFLCLFRPKSEMDKFEEKSGARVLFALASMRTTRGVPSFTIPSSEGAMLEAISAAITEVDSYKAKKEELEKEQMELLARIQEFGKELGYSTYNKLL
ncbi:hypothetical protein O6H91_12G015400 [Diphasiastrum complanatum]|uniref:Uncharacterized protein n=1 Tax=Diphasiastrum complanatum TaxID=34168 RepID=A0ACC2BZ26_DIPCM|nr:hypothetical protein O6H91_12G015400 [Diphasiastrum complanatum]